MTAIAESTGLRVHRLTVESRQCPVCGITFTPRYKERRQKLCSARCRGLKNTEMFRAFPPEVRKRQGETFGNRHRGTGEKDGYVKQNGRHQHRVVMEQKLGRPLAPGEIVHHLDGNKKNNAPENLSLLPSQSVHAKIHNFGADGKRFKRGDPGIRRGEESKQAKLNDEKVREIRTAYEAGGVSMKSLGLRFGVCGEMIHRIVKRKAWSHVA